jgi:hypothetical protein
MMTPKAILVMRGEVFIRGKRKEERGKRKEVSFPL